MVFGESSRQTEHSPFRTEFQKFVFVLSVPAVAANLLLLALVAVAVVTLTGFLMLLPEHLIR
jgi:hypothetical protein